MAEKEYIEREALMSIIEAHQYLLRDSFNSADYGMFTIGIKQAVDECLAADVVKVVRCKDCIHYSSNKPKSKLHRSGYCLHGEVTDDKREPNDFCSYGEKGVLTMAEIYKINVDKEFVIKISGDVETNLPDEKLKDVLDNMHKHLEQLIQNYILSGSKVSVEPVRHGHWETGYFHDRVCSCCTHPSNDLSDYPYSYCPCCGAKMDEKEREENE